MKTMRKAIDWADRHPLALWLLICAILAGIATVGVVSRTSTANERCQAQKELCLAVHLRGHDTFMLGCECVIIKKGRQP